MKVDRITESQWPAYLEDLLASDDQADYTLEINNWHTFLEREVLASFSHQQSPEGYGWSDWKWRNKKYHGNDNALVASGRLRDSFVKGSGDNIDKIDSKNGMYGSAVEYAGVHQYGSQSVRVGGAIHHRRNKQKYPYDNISVEPRPMLGVRGDMADALADSVADRIIEHMKG